VQDYHFGPFRLDLGNERLWRSHEEVILRPKSFAVLGYLVVRPGQLVTREEVLRATWPGIAVSDAVLTVCIGEIRQALGDNHHAPRYIETVHRRGYRFIATIRMAPGSEDPPGLERSPEAAPSPQGAFSLFPLGTQHSTLSTVSVAPSPQGAFSLFPLGTQHSALGTASVVGREAQVYQLESWLEQARQGRRQVVFVTGEAGIGKTTLVHAFLAQVASGEPLWVARGQCMAHYGAGEPYLPVLDALGRLCREPGSATLLTRLARANASTPQRGRARGPATPNPGGFP
jgi:DNA-binding winged helix-turn-helix (wHTH) protein